jgi:hypothetical protein
MLLHTLAVFVSHLSFGARRRFLAYGQESSLRTGFCSARLQGATTAFAVVGPTLPTFEVLDMTFLVEHGTLRLTILIVQPLSMRTASSTFSHLQLRPWRAALLFLSRRAFVEWPPDDISTTLDMSRFWFGGLAHAVTRNPIEALANLASLLGLSTEPDEFFLVFAFIARGTAVTLRILRARSAMAFDNFDSFFLYEAPTNRIGATLVFAFASDTLTVPGIGRSRDLGAVVNTVDPTVAVRSAARVSLNAAAYPGIEFRVWWTVGLGWLTAPFLARFTGLASHIRVSAVAIVRVVPAHTFSLDKSLAFRTIVLEHSLFQQLIIDP